MEKDIETDDLQAKRLADKDKAEKKPAVKKKKKEGEDGSVNNSIEINPQMNDSIKEAKSDTVVLGWGRMNPITTGHEKLANKVTQVARQSQGTPKIYLSHSTDPKKNPLSYNDKVSLAQKAFGNIIVKSNAKTIIQVMQELQRQHKNVVLIVGSDRVQQFDQLLNKYNGKDYTFDSIKVVSAGERDPDADDVSGMSASKMRAMAANDNRTEFKKGLPAKLKRDGDKIFDMVRQGMKLAEELEAAGLLDEAVLTYTQRRQRGLIMRKYKNKIALARKRALRKAATMDKLKVRARKKAINIIRQKVAGKKGMNYADLSPGEKMLIDKRVAKKKAVIDRIAKRMIPQVRKADLQRLSGSKKMNEEFEALFEVKQDKDIKDREGTQPAKYHKGLAPSTKAARDAQFKKQAKMDDDDPNAYKPAPGDKEAETKQSKYTKRYHQMFNKEGQMKFDGRFRAFRAKKMAEESELQKTRDAHKDDRESMKRRHKDEIIDAKRRDLTRQAQEELHTDADILEWIDVLADELFESVELDEAKANDALKKKSEKSGVPLAILKKVFDRGVAAWKTGHRPGTTPQQWGFARVNSYITKGKTYHTTDKDLREALEEGVNDPGIFKAVFLAGGPGSGKSFIVGKTALTSLGLKLINSDDAFEAQLRKVGLKPTPEDIFSPKGQEVRGRAKALTGLKQKLALNGRLGLVVDGTGKDFDKIKKQAEELKKIGYEVAMIFVNTDLETAQARNKARERTLPEKEVEAMWKAVQNNIGKFQNLFGQNFIVVDNSDGANYEGGVNSAYKQMSAWVKKGPIKPAAKKWIRDAKAQRGIKEEVEQIEEGMVDSLVKDFEKRLKRAGNSDRNQNRERMATLAMAKKKGASALDMKNLDKAMNAVMNKLDEGYMSAKEAGAMEAGKKAARAGKKYTDNPHKKGSPEYLYWSKGHNKARMREETELDESFENFMEGSVEEANWAKKAVGKVVFKGKYKQAADTLRRLLDRKSKESNGRLKHSAEYYAARVLQTTGLDNKLDARTLAKMATEGKDDPCWTGYKQVGMKKKNGKEVPNCVPEGYGDMDRGTTSLTKKYVKDTPYQIMPNGVKKQKDGSLTEEVTQKQIKDLEVFADRLLNKFGIDVEFTRHFADRMNDARNNPEIKISELQQLFKKIAKNKGKNLKQNPDTEVVLKDIQKDLNLPVVINYNRKDDDFEVVNKTIMRKKNFSTSNKTIKY